MVRKSVLVYDLLRTEQPEEGFSEKEIIEQISNKHNITAGKALRKQVTVALRRGLDFGILAKRNKKFRFDPDGGKANFVKRRMVPVRRVRSQRKKNEKRPTKTRPRSKSGRSKKRKQSSTTPNANVPKSWVPNRRNLTDEPLSKVKKI
ncbi:uncharacterized protein LOC113464483 [Ceratina calcarata]|uniref:Uncharacterized protein LOC113464483 n=1 Tax=Ceratina calcarata TaxID=156304 RepID=A0AAJ7S2P1_9HYME|nr:uncharacterized protein LOC113464483 [Ceratina calcarata]